MNSVLNKAATGFLFSASVVVVAAEPAGAQDRRPGVWAEIGATAAVDESSARFVVMHSTGSIALRAAVTSATAVVRFNVHPSHNLHDWRTPEDDFSLDTEFFALIRDNGTAARVVLKLQEMDDATGAVRTVGVIDSNSPDQPPSTEYVRRSGSMRLLNGVFDFHNKSYFVEATLTKTAAWGNPGIKLVKIQQFP